MTVNDIINSPAHQVFNLIQAAPRNLSLSLESVLMRFGVAVEDSQLSPEAVAMLPAAQAYQYALKCTKEERTKILEACKLQQGNR